VQRVYFILAVAGWIWLVVAGLAVALMLWRKRKAQGAQDGAEVTSAASADEGQR
jgi:hypothetical protein